MVAVDRAVRSTNTKEKGTTMLKFDKKTGDIVIRIRANDLTALPDSKSGKTKVVASTNGFVMSTVDGAPELGTVKINMNVVK